MKFLTVSALFCFATVQATLQVVPGATWTASNGRHVQAHGAGITQVDGVYYMIGEDKTEGTAFHNINCYRSTNLVEWTYVGALLSRQSSGDLGPNRVVERPKVIYNSNTRQYVMYLHIDSSNYGEAKVGVATSSSVCGSYSYRGSFRPLGFESRDIGLFKDDDGSAYLLTEDRPNGLRIVALSADYLSVTRNVYLWNRNIESPAIWKTGGVYFMLGSQLTGWNSNDNLYSYATSLSGPWSEWQRFADQGSNTYNSQTSFILPLGNTAIYMGDRWDPNNLMRSTYIWLPLERSGNTIRLTNRVNWVPQVSSGTWVVGPTETNREGEAGTLSNGARSVSCSNCSGGSAAGWIGGPDRGALTLTGISSQATTRTTLRIRYLNGDSTQRFAQVTVNGETQTVAFLPTDNGNSPGGASVHVNLRAGSDNTITITTTDGSYGPDIDRVFVPVT
ncbi:galactan 1,3-beta-galactosidase [Stachybotrys elegans]|uniref:Galactan 1,3-beta-galactosidase n=1 Tax=Stachybotrys elegans TaxID=80388 RepID=A0A8K0SMI3_9HYPO|nr:galactan 1,3-beta-galactosidase [Stachybotrys elegans]